MGVAIAEIIVGFFELLFGRKLFWAFVAIGGFLGGWFLAPAFFHSLVTWERILIGGALGLLFGLLARRFVRSMVALAGFFFIGTAAVVLLRHLGPHLSSGSTSYWIAYIVAGLAGAVLLGVLFDGALIVITAVAGAGAAAIGVVHFVHSHPRWLQVVLFLVLVALGSTYQAWRFRRRGGWLGRGVYRVALPRNPSSRR